MPNRLAEHVRLWEEALAHGRHPDWSETVASLDMLCTWLSSAPNLPLPETGAAQLTVNIQAVVKYLLAALTDVHPKVVQVWSQPVLLF